MEILALIIVGALIIALGIALAPYIFWILGIGCAVGLMVLVASAFDAGATLHPDAENAQRLAREAEEPVIAKWIDSAPSVSGRRLRTAAVFVAITCLVSALGYLVA